MRYLVDFVSGSRRVLSGRGITFGREITTEREIVAEREKRFYKLRAIGRIAVDVEEMTLAGTIARAETRDRLGKELSHGVGDPALQSLRRIDRIDRNAVGHAS